MQIDKVLSDIQDHLMVNISAYAGKPMSSEGLIPVVNQALNEIYAEFNLGTDQAIIAVPSDSRVFSLELNTDDNFTYNVGGVATKRLAKDSNVILATTKSIREAEKAKDKPNEVLDTIVSEYGLRR